MRKLIRSNVLVESLNLSRYTTFSPSQSEEFQPEWTDTFFSQCVRPIAELQPFEWGHLSNIIVCYDTQCVKQFIEKRSTMIFNRENQLGDQPTILAQPTTITTSITTSFTSFFQSLPAFQSLSRGTQLYLCRVNIRPLIFPNICELNQSCFAEPWQVNGKYLRSPGEIFFLSNS